jgi:hypothetical protein
VVKQDDNGATFIVTAAETPWIDNDVAAFRQVDPRPIGAWTHPTAEDIPRNIGLPDGQGPDPHDHEPAY